MIVIVGDGLLGSELQKQTNWDILSRKKNKIDFTKTDWYNLLDNYDIIVNCVAFTETYSNKKNESWEVNVKSLDNLIEYCNIKNKKLVHISTDYLYAGSINEATEDDVPVHINTWYGYTKLVGDALVQIRSKSYLICRLSHKPYPFPYDNAWSDIKTNCDSVDIITSLLVKLIKNDAFGVFNVGTDEKSIYDIAVKTNKDVKKSFKPNYVPENVTMNLNKLNNFLK